MAMKVQCPVHPEVETALRCGKCGRPICPRCLVQTPVGARCADCAQLRRLPIYEVSAVHYLTASGVSLAVALGSGLLWGIIPLRGLLFGLVLAAAAGYVIGEAVSLSVNRKRGLGLQGIAGGGVLLSYLVGQVVPGVVILARRGLVDVGNLGLIVQLAADVLTRTLLDPFALIVVAIGIVVAASRLR